jgi:hypothetical protein
MPLCSKCHENEATIQFSTVMDGVKEETVHLCSDCSPPMGFDLKKFDLKEIEALSLIGKKCEFCGKTAFSGVTSAKGAIYWCFDCGLEFGRILLDLCISEQPDLMQRSREASSFLAILSDSELQAWLETANQKAVQILREKRQQDGRDKDAKNYPS